MGLSATTWNVLALPVNAWRCGSSWRQRLRTLRACWRLSRRLGEDGGCELVRFCGEHASRMGLTEAALAQIVRRAAQSAAHGAELDYLRRAVPAWADELREKRLAASGAAMRAALEQHTETT